MIVSSVLIICLAAAVCTASPYVQSTTHASVSYWAHASAERDGTAVLLLRLADATPLTALSPPRASMGPALEPVVGWLPSDALPTELRPPQQRAVTQQVVRITPAVEVLFQLSPDGALFVRPLTGDPGTLQFADIAQPIVIRYLPRNTDTDSERDYAPTLIARNFDAVGGWMDPSSPPLDAPVGALSAHITASLALLEARMFVLNSSTDGEHPMHSIRMSNCDAPLISLDHMVLGPLRGMVPMILADGIYHAVNATLDVYTGALRACVVLEFHAPNGTTFSNDGAINGWDSPVAIPLFD